MRNEHVTVRPRVFVSSVVRGFEEFRKAARRGIEAAQCEPVLVNEDLPSKDDSSRNACLDQLETCDALVLIIGARGGFQTPSGKLVVEEEYEHARRKKLRVFVFVQDGVAHDDGASRLVAQVSNYIGGKLRTTFSDPASLEHQVSHALTEARLSQSARSSEPSIIGEALTRRELPAGAGEPHVALAVLPQRADEVFSPVDLAKEELRDRLCEIGRRRNVGLFGQRGALDVRVAGDAIVIAQPHSAGRQSLGTLRVEIRESGFVLVHTAVRSSEFAPGTAARMIGVNEVVEADVVRELERAFAFVSAVFDEFDPHERHVSFLMNAALVGLGFRQLVPAANPTGPWSMRMSGDDDPIIAEGQPRRLTRIDLATPHSEIDRLMARFRSKS